MGSRNGKTNRKKQKEVMDKGQLSETTHRKNPYSISNQSKGRRLSNYDLLFRGGTIQKVPNDFFSRLGFLPAKSKLLVSGYLRQNEVDVFGSDDVRNSYYNLPKMTYNICVLYYHPMTIRTFLSGDNDGNFQKVAQGKSINIGSCAAKLSDDMPNEDIYQGQTKHSIEFIQHTTGPWRWYGFQLSDDAVIKEGADVTMSVWVKFVNKVPAKSSNFGLKQYGRMPVSTMNGYHHVMLSESGIIF